MSWQPTQEGLETILLLLKQSQISEYHVQNEVQKKLEELNQFPDFNNYLAFVFLCMTSEDEHTRSLGGLILKNNVKTRFNHLSPEVIEYIKKESISCIGDSSSLIRATVGILITSILVQGGLENWPNLFEILQQKMDSSNYFEVEGTLSIFQKISEDSSEMDDSILFEDSLKTVVPKFFPFFEHQHHKIRYYAISCINNFIVSRTHVLMPFIDSFIQSLFTIATDSEVVVRQNVIKAFVLLADVRMDRLIPHIHAIIEYMILNTQDTNESVALDACEFWITLAEQPICRDVLRGHLVRLLPILMQRMRYSENEILLVRADDDDEMIPDRDEDIKPRFHRARNIDTDSANLSDDDDDDDDDDYGNGEWNLRKCSAAGLDVLAGIYKDELLPMVLNILKETLSHPDWLTKEAAILALGAIAEGCYAGMAQHLPELVPFLIQSLSDPKALVRSITCWTLSRYAHWIISQSKDQYLNSLVTELLARILDRNKRVQEAACSAFATLEEEAGDELTPYLEMILRVFMTAFQKYQHKNLLILYDAIGTLADGVGNQLNKPVLIELLMPPLIQRWNSLNDDDKDLFPLLECFSSVATALASGFLPYCRPVYHRCLNIVEKTMQASIVYEEKPDLVDKPNKDFLIVALDLLSGLTEGLGQNIVQLIPESNLMMLLYKACCDSTAEVRQSAFALLGELAKSAFVYVEPGLGQFMPILAQNLDLKYISVCNNSTWAIGEIAVKNKEHIQANIPNILPQLIYNISQPDTAKTLLENTAITLGRIGLAAPNEVAPSLQRFIRYWCMTMRNIRDNEEKDSAFRGICTLIGLNLSAILPDFQYFCDAVAMWNNPKDDLKHMFHEILHTVRNNVGQEQWQNFLTQFPSALLPRLQSLYGI